MSDLKTMFPHRLDFVATLEKQYGISTYQQWHALSEEDKRRTIAKRLTDRNAFGFFHAIASMHAYHIEVTGSREPWTIAEAFPKWNKAVSKLEKELGLVYMDDLKRYLASGHTIAVRGIGKKFLSLINDKPAPSGSWFVHSIQTLPAIAQASEEKETKNRAEKIGALVHELILSELTTDELEKVFDIVLFARKG